MTNSGDLEAFLVGQDDIGTLVTKGCGMQTSNPKLGAEEAEEGAKEGRERDVSSIKASLPG